MAPWAAGPSSAEAHRPSRDACTPDVDRTEGQSRPEAAKVVTLSRLLARPVVMSRGKCYERSLLAYRFLSQAGADPRLVVAVKGNGGAMIAHAWVTVDGERWANRRLSRTSCQSSSTVSAGAPNESMRSARTVAGGSSRAAPGNKGGWEP